MLSPAEGAAALGQLDEVQRTSLWTLHCRASFAERGSLEDPEAARLGATLGPELRRAFGRPDPAFATRARKLDAALGSWLEAHPGATVISLGEGLETQRFRVAGYGRWVTVDLPEVIELRGRLIPPDERHVHLATSVPKLSWLDAVEPGAFVLAQGLFMYLDPVEVRRVLSSWAARARAQTGEDGTRGALVFDVVPPWVSALSRLRVPVGRRFRLPGMPWGATRSAATRLIEGAAGPIHGLRAERCPLPSGPLPIRGSTWIFEVRV